MSAPIPTPRMLAARMVWGVMRVPLALTVVLTPLSPQLLQIDAPLWRLNVVLSVAGLLGVAVESRRWMQQLRPLYGWLIRPASRREVPPSHAAVRDAFSLSVSLPRRISAWVLAGVALDLVFGISSSVTEARIGANLLALAVVAVSYVPSRLGLQRAVDGWLTRVPPGLVEEPTEKRLAASLRDACALGALGVGLGAMAPVVARLGHSNAAAMQLAWLVGATVVATYSADFLGRRTGARFAADVDALTARAEALLRDREAPRRSGLRAVDAQLDALVRRVDEASFDGARARQQIERAQQTKSQFLAVMSHDLRSPLNSVLGFAELLSSEPPGALTSAQRENVRMIQESAQDLLRLLTDILDSARLEAGRLTLRFGWTPSVEILTEAVRVGEDLARARGVRLSAELQPGLPPVRVDSERIVQAITGLLGHAARSMEAGGTIVVRARVAEGPPGPARQVRVEVTDRSASIPFDQQARIFDAFRELRAPSGRRVGGLGLGLSLARGLVRAHGGDVWFESDPGTGTTFTVALPVEDTTSAGGRR